MTAQLRQRIVSAASATHCHQAKSIGPKQIGRRWVSRRGCFWLTIAVTVVVALIGLLVVLYSFSDVFTPHRTVRYSIMFDAGSTGSRMHVFQFDVGSAKGGIIHLVNETYHRVSPGLSDYAKDPQHGADSLRSMLEKALVVVPTSMQSATMLSLKATAGLRLLPELEQHQLLEAVRVMFSHFPFRMGPRSVEIMDGLHEGFYAWVMVAFTLERKLSSNSVATLDLGGGSTQITFQPTDESTFAKKDHIHEFPLPGTGKQSVYVHSYLGGGQMYGRTEILKQSRVSENGAKIVVESPCIHPDVGEEDNSLFWEYIGYNYTVKPHAEGWFSFDNCYPLAQNYVKAMNIFAPKELPDKEMYLMSYYYDRAVESGLIRQGIEDHKELSVADFRRRAEYECRHRSTNLVKNEFLCVDLTYIYALLHDGLQLPDTTKLTVAEKLRGSAVSWALGAALSELEL